MTDKDTITLPREVVQKALDALDSEHPDIQLRAAIALRTALAAEQPKPESVVWWDVNKPLDYLTRCENGTTFHNRVIMPRHAVAWAYTNSPEDIEALRRDAERYRWLRENTRVWPSDKAVWAGNQIGAAAIWIKQSVDWVDDASIDAAIDAAIKGDKT